MINRPSPEEEDKSKLPVTKTDAANPDSHNHNPADDEATEFVDPPQSTEPGTPEPEEVASHNSRLAPDAHEPAENAADYESELGLSEAAFGEEQGSSDAGEQEPTPGFSSLNRIAAYLTDDEPAANESAAQEPMLGEASESPEHDPAANSTTQDEATQLENTEANLEGASAELQEAIEQRIAQEDISSADDIEAFVNRFRPNLQTFAGPLDLLLYLIHKNEVDIFDIPIQLILEQYMSYLAVLEKNQELDIAEAGTYLVMAARLMEIKSRMLLPLPEEEADEEDLLENEMDDPRTSLITQLLEYKEIKERAGLLEEIHKQRTERYERVHGDPLPPRETVRELGDVSLFDLCEAFQRAIADYKLRDDIQVIEFDEIPIEDVIRDIHAAFADSEDGKVLFSSILPDNISLSALVSYFLSILEMARLQIVRFAQDGEVGEITMWQREADPEEEDHDSEGEDHAAEGEGEHDAEALEIQAGLDEEHAPEGGGPDEAEDQAADPEELGAEESESIAAMSDDSSLAEFSDREEAANQEQGQ